MRTDNATSEKFPICRAPDGGAEVMSHRVCKVCGVTKDVSFFSSRLKTCKPCRAAASKAAYHSDPEKRAKTKERAMNWRAANRERVLEVDRARAKRNNAKYQAENPEKFAAKKCKDARRHKELHPERAAARQAVSDAIKAGRLVRPAACSSCGNEGRVEFDHTNGYDEPNWLVGVFLCKGCHWKSEHERRARERGAP